MSDQEEVRPAPSGRRRDGSTALRVQRMIAKDPSVTDLAIAAELGMAEQAVSSIRRKLNIDSSRKRVNWLPDERIGRCPVCMRFYRVPAGEWFTHCPIHEDVTIYATNVTLRKV